MKKDLITDKSGRIGIIIKAALLFFGFGRVRGGFLYFGEKRQPRLAYRRGGGRNCFLPFNSCIAYGKPRRTHAEHAFPPCNYYAVLSNRRNFGRKPKISTQIYIVMQN